MMYSQYGDDFRVSEDAASSGSKTKYDANNLSGRVRVRLDSIPLNSTNSFNLMF